MGIARTFQSLRLFLNMSSRRTSRRRPTASRTRRRSSRSCACRARAARSARSTSAPRTVLGFFGQRLLGYRFDQPAYVLSYANRRRLEIARAMATGARLLLLDEPAAGMNPNETHEITELIGRLRDERGYTILVIEHDMHVVEGISDRVVALDHGEKLTEGTLPRGRQPPRRDRGLPRTQPRGAEANERRRISSGAEAVSAKVAETASGTARRRCSSSTTSPPTTGRCGSSRAISLQVERRRARLPARRQRLGQVDDAQDDPRHRAPPQRARAPRRRGRQRPRRRRTGSPAASRSSPRTAASSAS